MCGLPQKPPVRGRHQHAHRGVRCAWASPEATSQVPPSTRSQEGALCMGYPRSHQSCHEHMHMGVLCVGAPPKPPVLAALETRAAVLYKAVL